jgi:phage shock protein PspC (stress-responsive transcriptional regulator)
LAIIAGLSAVVQAGFHLTGKLGPSFAPYAGTAFLVMGVASGLLQLFGLDHWLTIMAHFSIALSTGFLLAWLVARLFWTKREEQASHG